MADQPKYATTMPSISPMSASEVSSPEPVPESAVSLQAQRTAVLLIDDEHGMQRALRRLLQRDGYDITTAADGVEGLAAIEKGPYQAILCDMRMPNLDGPGFFHALQRCYPHLVSRLIFLTGDVMSSDVQTFFTKAGRPYLLKPFKAQEVRRLLQRVLEAKPNT